MIVTCEKCSKTYESGCVACPWCGQPAEKLIDTRTILTRLPDTPENRAKQLKEYKIIGQEDEWLNGGRFDKISMENMLNSYSRRGWIVKEISSSKTFGIFFGTPRD